MKDRIFQYVANHPGRSATQIAHALSINPNVASARLLEMTQMQWVRRVPNTGPRGGYTYFLS